jgi:hypothetical protein
MSSFDDWFKRATGNDPFPYHRRFAKKGEIPQLVDVPTGVKRKRWQCLAGHADQGSQSTKS